MILHIYSGNLFGGIETNLLALMNADSGRFDQGPDRHQLALCFEGRLSQELLRMGRPPIMLCPVRMRYPWTLWRARRILRQALLKSKIKFIVAHAAWSYKLVWPVAREFRIPIAFWNHDILTGSNSLERFAAAHPPVKLLTNSQFTVPGMESLFHRHVDAVIYPVAHLKTVADKSLARLQIRNEFQTPQDSVVITQFSRFERWKGQSLLLSALGHLNEDPSWRLWLVGGVQKPNEIQFRDELIAQAKKLGIFERVRFTGQRSDIAQVLAASDIHTQPNLQPEPFGLCYIEALAAGLPSVAVNFGGAAEILTPECGRLVPPDDPLCLSDTLSGLIRNPNLRNDLSRNGPARARFLCDPVMAIRQLEQTLMSQYSP